MITHNHEYERGGNWNNNTEKEHIDDDDEKSHFHGY